MKVKLLGRVRLFATLWTVAYQAPPSMAFSRQEYWSGLPFPSPGDLPDPGIELGSPVLQAFYPLSHQKGSVIYRIKPFKYCQLKCLVNLQEGDKKNDLK